MLILIYLFIFLGVVFIGIGIFSRPGYKLGGIALADAPDKLKKIKTSSFIARALPFTQRLLEKVGLEAKIKNKLDAGRIRLTAQEFVNLKILSAVTLAVCAILILGKFGPLAFFGGLFLGYIILDLWLKRKIAKRKYEIVRVLPETVDLLGLCVEAGLDFASAVKWVIDKVPSNPLMEELGFVLEEIKWGKPRTQALRDMSRRLNIPEISSFVQTLVQAERMGTPVAEAFAILSEDSRLQRFHRGERIALKAPIKVLIPLIFCILPVIAIVIGGPILLQFMQGKLF